MEINQNIQGNWKDGIPDFVGLYTYFRTLGTSQNPAARQLYSDATAAIENISSQLSNEDNIQIANNFIHQVAISERGKEIAAIQAYCKQLNTSFPALEPFLNDPDSIYKDPQTFYTQLTAAMNKIRMGAQEYKNELERIRRNILDVKRNIHSYQADDYRYKLVQDMTSFLSRLSGDTSQLEELMKHGYKGDSAFTSRMEDMVIRILDKTNIIEKIESAEDFAAIAANVLVDLEKMVQKEIDESPEEKRSLDNVSKELLDRVEDYYMFLLQQESTKQTPVQRALLNLNGIDFNRITQNAKEILGIKTKEFSDDLLKKEYIDKIKKDERKEDIELVKKFRQRINKNKNLRQNLRLIDFSIGGSYKTKHGNINELIRSAIGRNVSANVATDIITYTINWDTQINTEEFDTLISSIGNEFSSVLGNTKSTESKKDIEKIVTAMNKRVDDLIKKAEEQIKAEKEYKDKDLFIFHESLKLYSSAEKYKGAGISGHAGFGGRSMNILSYIGYLSSANSVGINNNPLDKNSLNLLAYNLVPGAIADDQREPLERYFSIYAGLLMFDDVALMAEEAISQVNSTNDVIGGKIRQIHLYNLNGIYVPASMILTYISNSLSQLSHINPEDFAHAKISINGSFKPPEHQKLTPAIWSSIAADAASAVSVKLIILETFISFINLLPFA